MSGWKKLAAASAATAGGLNVEDLFSVYTYFGNGTSNSTTQDIVNGIDLANEGGMVWIKDRFTKDHFLFDTERGVWKYLRTNSTDGEPGVNEDALSAFNDDGFTVTGNNNVNQNYSYNSQGQYCSWTWRKAPKFFDCIEYTGTGSARSISHNLGCDVGMVVIKMTNGSKVWRAWHRGLASGTDYINFNTTAVASTSTEMFTNVTSTEISLGTSNSVNGSGDTYIAYIFAHNDGDGEFGPTGDQDIIKCGSYTGNGNNNGPIIDLGFEPQYLLIRRTDSAEDWFIADTLRGIAWTVPSITNLETFTFTANTSNSQGDNGLDIQINPDGFRLATTTGKCNASGGNYIYMAIRRGPMAIPTDATTVFDIGTGSDGNSTTEIATTNGPVDMIITGLTNSNSNKHLMFDRLRNYKARFQTQNFALGEDNQFTPTWDWALATTRGHSIGCFGSSLGIHWSWKRAPSFFDVVAFVTTQDGSGTNNNASFKHNLGVVPEMMWVRVRNYSRNFYIYHKNMGRSEYLRYNNQGASLTSGFTDGWGTSDPTDTHFFMNEANIIGAENRAGIAYLFASLDGVSKVGHYTGNGAASQDIDCGFTNGARFVWIKRQDASQIYSVWDAERGIVAGNDPLNYFCNSFADKTDTDYIDPLNSGFTVVNSDYNVNGGTYLFYAIA